MAQTTRSGLSSAASPLALLLLLPVDRASAGTVGRDGKPVVRRKEPWHRVNREDKEIGGAVDVGAAAVQYPTVDWGRQPPVPAGWIYEYHCPAGCNPTQCHVSRLPQQTCLRELAGGMSSVLQCKDGIVFSRQYSQGLCGGTPFFQFAHSDRCLPSNSGLSQRVVWRCPPPTAPLPAVAAGARELQRDEFAYVVCEEKGCVQCRERVAKQNTCMSDETLVDAKAVEIYCGQQGHIVVQSYDDARCEGQKREYSVPGDLCLTGASGFVSIRCPVPKPGPRQHISEEHFAARKCGDANCAASCTMANMWQRHCYPSDNGGSEKVSCAPDGKTVEVKYFSNRVCEGASRTSQHDVDTCVATPGGASTSFQCPLPDPCSGTFNEKNPHGVHKLDCSGAKKLYSTCQVHAVRTWDCSNLRVTCMEDGYQRTGECSHIRLQEPPKGWPFDEDEDDMADLEAELAAPRQYLTPAQIQMRAAEKISKMRREQAEQSRLEEVRRQEQQQQQQGGGDGGTDAALGIGSVLAVCGVCVVVFVLLWKMCLGRHVSVFLNRRSRDARPVRPPPPESGYLGNPALGVPHPHGPPSPPRSAGALSAANIRARTSPRLQGRGVYVSPGMNPSDR